MKIKLSKRKKIILLLSTIGVLVPSITTPIIVINNKKKQKNAENKKDVKTVIKILEEKLLSERQIELSSDSKGKIVANNREEIIKKIKQLIGEPNLRGVSIKILMEKDKDISTSFQEIKVKVSKGNYSQEVNEDKTIFVKRSRTISELALIDINSIKNALEALATKVVDVYTIGAIDQKITTNKLEILKTIKKISNFPKNLKEVKIEIENSKKLLPRNDQQPVSIVVILSKNGVSKKVLGFKAKQMSALQANNYELNLIKTTLESLNKKIVEVYSFDAIDQKITTNKLEILSEIQKLDGYPQDLKGVNVEVKNSDALLTLNNQEPVNITLILSKVGASPSNIELEGFGVKQQFYVIEDIKSKIINKEILIKSSVSTQNPEEVQSAILQQLKIENDTLTDEDIQKISTNISSLDKGVRTEVQLTITFKQRSKKITIHVEKHDLLKGLEILNGNSGTIFEDDFGNLWIMSIRQRILTPRLFVLRKGSNSWTKDTSSGLTKNSNITDGINGTIFQDKFKNLWTMGKGTKLQVLKVNENGDGYDEETGWIENTSDQLLTGSNITDGEKGTIFQDDFGNLWIMGIGTKLQILKVNKNGDGYVNAGWTNNNQLNGETLLQGSNISNGEDGTIFQDRFKNLWAMGKGTSLQVLRVNTNKNGYDESVGWSSAINSGLTNGSNIENGYGGTIFQDNFGNLWAMGSSITKDVDGTEKTIHTKLQVLKINQNKNGYVNSWTNDNSEDGEALLKNSNINNGANGEIFQDDFGNLWTMGTETSLQVLRVNAQKNGYRETIGWINDNSALGLLNGSNILEGGEGIIFQDAFGNLWAMADSKLQVLKVNKNSKNGYANLWTDDDSATGLLKGSKILQGYAGAIFQDKFKNLWVMGANKKVQVLKIKSDNSYDDTWES